LKTIKYPIVVKEIKLPDEDPIKVDHWTCETGAWIAITPCEKEYKNKTYLGIFLGEAPISCMVIYNKDKELEFLYHRNPAIYIPDLKKIIYGCGSWWKKIESPDDLKDITSEDINNVWYVKALKEIIKDNSPME
jgi:hypothetical protein